jgi:hypothetical protein
MKVLGPLAIVMIAFLIPERSSACSCRPTSLREQFGRASIVFVATVIESRMDEPSIGQHRPADVRVTARFRVEEEIKGNAGDVTALRSTVTLLGEKPESRVVSSCGRTQQFAIGSQFLVFATGPGEVEVEACSATRILEYDRQRILDEVRAMSSRK